MFVCKRACVPVCICIVYAYVYNSCVHAFIYVSGHGARVVVEGLLHWASVLTSLGLIQCFCSQLLTPSLLAYKLPWFLPSLTPTSL